MQTQDRPNEPGIWTRDGDPAVYRVWQGEHLRFEMLMGSVNQYLASQAPIGNWRKLTPSEPTIAEHYKSQGIELADREMEEDWLTPREPVTCDEADKKFRDWITQSKHCPCSIHRQMEIADKAAEIFAGVRQTDPSAKIDEILAHEPPPESKQFKSLRIAAGRGLREFSEHCKVLPSRYCEFENGRGELNVAEVLRIVEALKGTPQPEVIEGRGQAVTEEGWYWYEDSSGNVCTGYKTKDCHFARGIRYLPIPIPTFPPRPTFTAPPKPEQSTIDLTLQAPIGSAVHWKTLGGKEYVGKLIEWDSNVAIVKTDSGVKAVEC